VQALMAKAFVALILISKSYTFLSVEQEKQHTIFPSGVLFFLYII
jgi:hypothetical protein